MRRLRVGHIAAWLLGAGLALGGSNATAGSGPFGIDHRIAYDDSRIWARHSQQALEIGVIAALAIIAVVAYVVNGLRGTSDETPA